MESGSTSYGFMIESLDNPGWQVRINLTETELEETVIPYESVETSENNWYGYKIENNVFHGAW